MLRLFRGSHNDDEGCIRHALKDAYIACYASARTVQVVGHKVSSFELLRGLLESVTLEFRRTDSLGPQFPAGGIIHHSWSHHHTQYRASIVSLAY